MSIADNVARVLDDIAGAALRSNRSAGDITLVAATKTVDAGRIREAIKAGISFCGENRVQEFMDKQAQGAYDGCAVHFIGKLQRNKVQKVVGRVSLIQSVDSVLLASDIAQKSKNLGIISDILLEVNIGGEDSKSGFEPVALKDALKEISGLDGIRVRGIMSIPPYTSSQLENERFFFDLHKLYVDIREDKYDNTSIDILSMGMSGDYKLAIEQGANMVRVGSAIFGHRI